MSRTHCTCGTASQGRQVPPLLAGAQDEAVADDGAALVPGVTCVESETDAAAALAGSALTGLNSQALGFSRGAAWLIAGLSSGVSIADLAGSMVSSESGVPGVPSHMLLVLLPSIRSQKLPCAAK
jgi:hypothetical protein